MSTIRIQTTQNVALEYEVAGIGDRIVAALIDYALFLAWIILLFVISSQLKIDMGLVFYLLLMLPMLLYHLVCEVAFNGQSLGKHARDIRVVRLDGTPPRLGNYLLRWILTPVDAYIPPLAVLPSGAVGLITMLVNGRGQRVGDLAAGTTVIRLNPRQAVSPLPVLSAEEAANYRVTFPLASLLADHDAALVRQLLQRGLQRDDYLLLNEVANKVKSLTGIQTDMPDEPFLRTVLLDHAHLAHTGPYAGQ